MVALRVVGKKQDGDEQPHASSHMLHLRARSPDSFWERAVTLPALMALDYAQGWGFR